MAMDISNSLNFFAKGEDSVNRAVQNVGRLRAGNALARGDMEGGMNALYRSGDFDTAGNIQEQQHRGDYLKFQRDQMKASAEDKQRERAAKEREDRGKFFLQAASLLEQIPEGPNGDQTARNQGFEKLVPTFQAMGLDAQTIETMRKADKSNGSLQAFKGSIQREIATASSDGNIIGYDKNTGEKLWSNSVPKERKGSWKERKKAGGQGTEWFWMWDPTDGPAPASGAPSAAPASAPAGNYRDAIANIESRGRGDYKAEGPVTKSGDKAYGRYQVMGANIPQWTREVLGRSMTPQEFLANPQAQDAVFDAKFGEFAKRYGSPEEAASVWFTGKPMAQGAGRRDQLGTTGAQYVQKFARNMQTAPGAAPTASDVGDGMVIAGDAPGGAGHMATPEEKRALGLPGELQYWLDENGKPIKVEAAGAEKTSESERTAGFLASRLASSLKNISAAVADDPSAKKPGLLESAARNVPWIGGEGTANLVRSPDRQQVVANQIDILDAALTLGTGAAYNREQLEGYRQAYFPALTDKPETVAAKARKLVDLLKSAQIKAGRAAPPELAQAIAAAEQQFVPQQPRQGGQGAQQGTRQAQGGGASPPAAALKAGQITTFANGQRWTLRGGKPVRVN